jgi:Flp pilus assembly protein TadG
MAAMIRRIKTWRRHLKRRSISGSAAMEFALIAPVFFAIFFAILETGLVFFANAVLQNGMQDAARLIRTGQAQGTMDATAFRTYVCGKVSSLLSCDASKLYIDVRSFTNFSSAAYPTAINANGTLNTTLNSYQLGKAGDVVLVRGFYTWPLFTPVFSAYFSNLSGNVRLISASAAFRNEPF